MKHCVLLLFISVFSVNVTAQTDAFSGTWQMSYPSASGGSIELELHIAEPEKNQLYPAKLSIHKDSFNGTYHLLLYKRSVRQLAIGRHKIPVEETPFSLGDYTFFLNGFFDLSRDLKGSPTLTAERLFIKQQQVMPEIATFSSSNKNTASALFSFLKEGDIRLKKLNTDPYTDNYTDTVLQPKLSPHYFGIKDSITVNEKNGTISFTGNKKSENGIVSVLLNGSPVIDQNDLTQKKPIEDLRLDTGLNILVFYADDYGKSLNSTGKLNVAFGTRKIALDFSNKSDLGATFIVQRIFYYPEKEKENPGGSNFGYMSSASDADIQRDIKNYHYPDPSGRNLFRNDSAKAISEKTLLRTSKTVGNIKATTKEIILAIWDDALEDGDSVSVNINGNWIVQGFAVRKKPQFISVKIESGKNKIVFIAENLGSVSPNTSVLEIIDGKQRKSFMIDTNLEQNNQINIVYEGN